MDSYQHKVQYYETDKMGITHHSNYIHWMEESRVYFLDKIGWGFEKLEKCGIISPVTAISCNYVNSTTFADIVNIEVSVEELRHVKIKIKYKMTNENGKLVCECTSEHCFLNSLGKIVNIKKDLPEFFEALSSAITSE